MNIRTSIATIATAATMILAPQGIAHADDTPPAPDQPELASSSVAQPGIKYTVHDSNDAEHNGGSCTLGPAITKKDDPSSHYFLTAGHCAHEGSSITMDLGSGQEKVGVVVQSNNTAHNPKARELTQKEDTAIIKMDSDVPVSAKLATFSKTKKQKISPHALSYQKIVSQKPMLCGVAVKSGRFCDPMGSNAEATETKQYVPLSESVINGDSGAPIFAVDRDGRVHYVGVVSADIVSADGSEGVGIVSTVDDMMQQYGFYFTPGK